MCSSLLAATAACSGASTAPASGNNGQLPPNTVDANVNNAFDPGNLTVAAGTVVNFQFDATGHNVNFSPVTGAPASILGTNSNTTISRTFGTAGTFPYQCTIHPGMNGTITVQ
jgi:plastocyanin